MHILTRKSSGNHQEKQRRKEEKTEARGTGGTKLDCIDDTAREYGTKVPAK
jgi:hypothetical protein